MLGIKRKARSKNGSKFKRLRILGTEGPDLINNLNNDCLAKIFSYIPVQERFTLQAVCKRWNSELAWRDVKSLDFAYHSVPKLIRQGTKGLQMILKKCGRFLHELNLGRGAKSTMLPVIGDNCQMLRKLEIRLDYEDNRWVGWSIQMDRMQHFNISANSEHFTANFFEYLSHGNFTELHLSVSKSENVWPVHSCHPPLIAADALEKFTELTCFTLSGFVLTSIIVMIIGRMANLTFLSLAYCTVRDGLPHMDLLTNLEHLDVSDISQVNDSFIIEISKNCKKLKVLKLCKCRKVSDIGITTLQTLPLLEKLLLNGIYEITDEPLSQLQTLEALECENCYSVKDDGVIELMKYASNLKYLNLIHTEVTSEVLTYANQILRRRTNNIALQIDIHHHVTDHLNRENCSPLLYVKSVY